MTYKRPWWLGRVTPPKHDVLAFRNVPFQKASTVIKWFFGSKLISDLIISYLYIGSVDRSYLIQQRYVIYVIVRLCVSVRGWPLKLKGSSLTRRCLLWGLQDEVDDGATGEATGEVHELCVLAIPLIGQMQGSKSNDPTNYRKVADVIQCVLFSKQKRLVKSDCSHNSVYIIRCIGENLTNAPNAPLNLVFAFLRYWYFTGVSFTNPKNPDPSLE